MDWGSLIGGVVLLGVIALVLQLLWRALLGLLLFGPPAYGGVIIGHCVGVLTASAPLAVLTAIVAAGAFAELVRAGLRSLWWRL
jgi:hypothetical protein